MQLLPASELDRDSTNIENSINAAVSRPETLLDWKFSPPIKKKAKSIFDCSQKAPSSKCLGSTTRKTTKTSKTLNEDSLIDLWLKKHASETSFQNMQPSATLGDVESADISLILKSPTTKRQVQRSSDYVMKEQAVIISDPWSDFLADSEVLTILDNEIAQGNCVPDTAPLPKDIDDTFLFNDIHPEDLFDDELKAPSLLAKIPEKDHFITFVELCKRDFDRFSCVRMHVKDVIVPDENETTLILVYNDPDGDVSSEYILKFCISASSGWLNHSYHVGDWLNICGPLYQFLELSSIGPLQEKQEIISTINPQLMLVYWPEILVSGTSMSDAFSCLRRAFINIKYPALSTLDAILTADLETTSSYGESGHNFLITGNILHEVLQEAFKNSCFTTTYLEGILSSLLKSHTSDLLLAGYDSGAKVLTLFEYLKIEIRKIVAFYEEFVAKSSRASESKLTIQYEGTHDIEESLWSYRLGLKGKLDASVQVKVIDRKVGNSRSILVPFELKTGSGKNSIKNSEFTTASINHRIQLFIYTLLLEERSKSNITYGWLFYLSTLNVKKGSFLIERNDQVDTKGILILRNTLVSYLRKSESSPLSMPPILPRDKQGYTCAKCHLLKKCTVLASLKGHAQFSHDDIPKYEKFEPAQIKFFENWEIALGKEEKFTNLKDRHDFWKRSFKLKESMGQAVSRLSISWRDNMKYLVKCESFNLPATFSKGDIVWLRLNVDDLYGVARILELSGTSVLLQCERLLPTNVGFLNMEINSMYSSQLANQRSILLNFICNGQVRNLLINNDRLVLQNSANYNEDKAALFDQYLRENLNDQNLRGSFFKTFCESLNSDQQSAIISILKLVKVHLLWGMPGTGKTFALVFVLKILISCRKRVLLSSYTHNAIDTVLDKLGSFQTQCWRLGRPESSSVLLPTDIYLDHSSTVESPEKLKSVFTSRFLVAGTVMSLHNAAILTFNVQQNCVPFDYCFLDEASQITLPLSLLPLQLCTRLVLIGDHKQLPPLVQSSAVNSLLGTSLFHFFMDKYKLIDNDCVSNLAGERFITRSKLSIQYRMHEHIMDLSNCLFYSFSMKSHASNAKLVLDWKIKDSASATSWLSTLFSKSVHIAFLNTPPEALEKLSVQGKSGLSNPYELAVITKIIESVEDDSMIRNNLTVLIPYRYPCEVLRSSLQAKSLPLPLISTIDKYQGKENDCIIISLIRSNMEKVIGDLLSLEERLNVAFTRARKKLIIIGNLNTLRSSSGSCLFQRMFTEQFKHPLKMIELSASDI